MVTGGGRFGRPDSPFNRFQVFFVILFKLKYTHVHFHLLTHAIGGVEGLHPRTSTAARSGTRRGTGGRGTGGAAGGCGRGTGGAGQGARNRGRVRRHTRGAAHSQGVRHRGRGTSSFPEAARGSTKVATGGDGNQPAGGKRRRRLVQP